jgi:hypothetical protein
MPFVSEKTFLKSAAHYYYISRVLSVQSVALHAMPRAALRRALRRALRCGTVIP